MDGSAATNGFGPVEVGRSNGEGAAGDGNPMRIEGVRYATGLGVHSFSSVTYPIGGRFSRFTTAVGVDDEVGDRGSVAFRIYVDGDLAWDSGVTTGQEGPRAVAVDVRGGDELTLVVTDAGDGGSHDHANWAGAALTE
jgi:hypothetical protein